MAAAQAVACRSVMDQDGPPVSTWPAVVWPRTGLAGTNGGGFVGKGNCEAPKRRLHFGNPRSPSLTQMASARCSHCVCLSQRTGSACLGRVELRKGILGCPSCEPMGITTLEIPVATQPTPHSVNRSLLMASEHRPSCLLTQPCGGHSFGPRIAGDLFVSNSPPKWKAQQDWMKSSHERIARRDGPDQGNREIGFVCI